MPKTISDPISGLSYCNHEIAKLEARAVKLQALLDSVNDEKVFALLNKSLNSTSWHKHVWAALAEKYLHQIHQQGLKTVSVTKAWAARKR